mgnify:FL=1|jgi:hypothetical protein|tara:strand:- start:201 stop:386 length:186 start_codon:yes stop_codon:yes gene_type:complete
MGKMKAWMMDMEDQVDEAMKHFGGSSTKDNVLNYVKDNMDIVDEEYVISYTRDKFLKGIFG